VIIRILGDFAIIHARTTTRKQMVPRGPAATPMIGAFAMDAGNASRPTSRAYCISLSRHPGGSDADEPLRS
jgi:hypothetical protein